MPTMDEILTAAEQRAEPRKPKVKGEYVNTITVADDTPPVEAMGFEIGVGVDVSARGVSLPVLFMRKDETVRPQARVPLELVTVALANGLLDSAITRAAIRRHADGGLVEMFEHLRSHLPTAALRELADSFHDEGDARGDES